MDVERPRGVDAEARSCRDPPTTMAWSRGWPASVRRGPCGRAAVASSGKPPPGVSAQQLAALGAQLSIARRRSSSSMRLPSSTPAVGDHDDRTRSAYRVRIDLEDAKPPIVGGGLDISSHLSLDEVHADHSGGIRVDRSSPTSLCFLVRSVVGPGRGDFPVPVRRRGRRLRGGLPARDVPLDGVPRRRRRPGCSTCTTTAIRGSTSSG